MNFVSWKNSDSVHSHLSGTVSEDLVPVFEFYFEHCIGQWLNDRSFENDGIFFRLGQVSLLKNRTSTTQQHTAMHRC